MERVSLFINRITHQLSAILIMALMGLTVMDVAGRFLFNRPIRGTFELTEFALVLIVFFALGYAQHNDDHVAIDLLYTRFPKVGQRVLDIFSALLSVTVISLMSWRLYVYSGRMLAGNYTTAVLRIPLHPLVLLAALGTIGFILALITSLFKPQDREGSDKA